MYAFLTCTGIFFSFSCVDFVSIFAVIMLKFKQKYDMKESITICFISLKKHVEILRKLQRVRPNCDLVESFNGSSRNSAQCGYADLLLSPPPPQYFLKSVHAQAQKDCGK